MNTEQSLAYVRASAQALGLTLDEARVQRVAAHLQRTSAMAALLEGTAWPDELEIAEIYKPNRHPARIESA